MTMSDRCLAKYHGIPLINLSFAQFHRVQEWTLSNRSFFRNFVWIPHALWDQGFPVIERLVILSGCVSGLACFRQFFQVSEFCGVPFAFMRLVT